MAPYLSKDTTNTESYTQKKSKKARKNSQRRFLLFYSRVSCSSNRQELYTGKTTVVVVTDRDGTVDSRVEEGIEAGDSTRASQASKRGERRSRTDGHGSTGELMQQAGCGVNRMVQSTDHSQWISLRSLQELAEGREEERKRGGDEERERKVRREFLSPGGCRREKEKRSRESRREVEVPGPSVGAFAARAVW